MIRTGLALLAFTLFPSLGHALDVDDVQDMLIVGMAEETIITIIACQSVGDELTTHEIVRLRFSGASDAIIEAVAGDDAFADRPPAATEYATIDAPPLAPF